MLKIPTIEEMLKAGMHFGHRTSRWHPKMEPFIFGARKGIHIIDLTKTQKSLIEALNYIKQAATEGKTILLVGTKQQSKEIIKKAAIEANVSYVSAKWLGGSMTNFAVIRKLIKKYKDLLEQKNTGKLNKYTKKERLEFDREITRLENKVGGLADLTHLPDMLFIWDVKNESNAVAEAKKKNIPIVGVCDTNTNPKNINYVIAANDDATKGIKLVLNLVRDAILEGKAEREKNSASAVSNK
jgi:small subunit ribosomal protein S2